MPHSERPTRYKVAHMATIVELHLTAFGHALLQALACALDARFGRTQTQSPGDGKFSLRHALQVAQRDGLAVFDA